jgi:hypothetical protein
MEDIEISLTPYAKTVEEWCPTSYVPAAADTNAAAGHLGTLSAPPISDDAQRMKAMYDSLIMSETLAARWSAGDTSWFLQHYCQIMGGASWGTIAIVFEGADPTGAVNMEVVMNHEGITDSRTLSFVQRATAGTAMDHGVHNEVVRHIARSVPATKHKSKVHNIWNDLREVALKATGVISAAPKVFRAIESAATAVAGSEIFGEVVGGVLGLAAL